MRVRCAFDCNRVSILGRLHRSGMEILRHGENDRSRGDDPADCHDHGMIFDPIFEIHLAPQMRLWPKVLQTPISQRSCIDGSVAVNRVVALMPFRRPIVQLRFPQPFNRSPGRIPANRPERPVL
jgi:hypothetical protein